jgi:hypothetical protein
MKKIKAEIIVNQLDSLPLNVDGLIDFSGKNRPFVSEFIPDTVTTNVVFITQPTGVQITEGIREKVTEIINMKLPETTTPIISVDLDPE